VDICKSVIIAVEIGIAQSVKDISERNGYRQEKENYCQFLIFAKF